ncbi:conserved hypothetical protein [Alteromonas sp. 38]|uniref:hypothetical protein n=1 Tax=unclassified Alteromonas TaxID=2614992 RepID=UPI0012F3CD85|nr:MULTISPECIES: hypothetical protein [unclassified Alteromonas]CAD5268480.1 conserved hypothetical protein [Alteromonas sp. 154]VXC02654.1 conserved hypothetical protein [Alteromonas sp. 38]
MQLSSDFFGDWLNILKEILRNHWGYDISGIKEEELPYLYFNAEKRRPDQRIRSVEVSDIFTCPVNLQAGWERLKSVVESGEDITPNLSKLVGKLNNKDSLLNDWGVHHFHLGESLDGNFIERTGPLLFALITKNKFYAINVFRHGAWADQDIVEIIHRNWPDVVSHYQIKNVISATELSESERLTLRSKNLNNFSTVSDGTIYAPIGDGVVSSGYNARSIINTDRQRSMLRNLEEHLQSQLVNLKDTLCQHGYLGEEYIKATLEITDSKYLAIFPDYNVAVTLIDNAQKLPY